MDNKLPVIGGKVTPEVAALNSAAFAEQTESLPLAGSEDPEPENAHIPELSTVVGNSLELGDKLLLGSSVYTVTKVPSYEQSSTRTGEKLDVPGHATYRSGTSLAASITLWAYDNYTRINNDEVAGGQSKAVTGQSTTATR